jgi:hypothetical protein
MTVQDVITYALISLGEIQPNETPNTDENNWAFANVNLILSSWSLEGFTVYTHQISNFALQTGVISYTMGVGGTWGTTARPVKIKGATARSTVFENGLTVLPMAQFEAAVRNPTGRSDILPSLLGEDSAAPLKNIRIWPPPAANASIEISFWIPFTAFVSPADTVSFPEPGLELALIGELALTLAPGFGRPVNAELAGNAQRAKQRIIALGGQVEVGAVAPAAPAVAPAAA